MGAGGRFGWAVRPTMAPCQQIRNSACTALSPGGRMFLCAMTADSVDSRVPYHCGFCHSGRTGFVSRFLIGCESADLAGLGSFRDYLGAVQPRNRAIGTKWPLHETSMNA